MSPTRKTATNWLSANGYRLILGVLVSVFALTAFAADCKVNDSEISGEYVGGCVNGLAHGKGKANGKDTYEGEFKQGNKHGKGIYSWSAGGTYEGNYLDDRMSGKGVMIFPSRARYEGDWLKGLPNGKGIWHYKDGTKYDGEFQINRRHGFGKMTIPRNAYDAKNFSGNGTWVDDSYFLTGMFEDNTLILSCTSPQNCKQEQAKREAQERRDQAARDEQYRRDAPARQARQMCEAQKQTCKAGCGPITYWNGRSYVDNPNYNSCDYRCSQISCN